MIAGTKFFRGNSRLTTSALYLGNKPRYEGLLIPTTNPENSDASLKGGGRPVVVNVYPRAINIYGGSVREALGEMGASWAQVN